MDDASVWRLQSQRLGRFVIFGVVFLIVDTLCRAQQRVRPSIGNAETLSAGYQRWRARREQSGASATLVIPLTNVAGLATETTSGKGTATLKLGFGALRVEVSALAKSGYDVWLIDNLPGPQKSVQPEVDDPAIHAGRLQRSASGWLLESSLDLPEAMDFELDRIVVTFAGQHPSDGLLLSGSPSLYQRMYAEELRQSQTGNASNSLQGPPPLWKAIPGPASQAAGTVEDLIAFGEDLFVNETFAGNGRTCATCHPPINNFTVDVPFIASLPGSDPLFVHETDPLLADLEDPDLLRNFALFKVNNDGLDQPGVFRSAQHTLALTTSIASDATEPPLEATGWSGEGAPANGTLRDFPIGAVIQHAPKTLNREDGTDFRLPTEEELDAMVAFQLSLGRSSDPDLIFTQMSNPDAEAGRRLFLTEDTGGGQRSAGKCNLCHENAGAAQLRNDGINQNFNTGVEDGVHPAGVLPRDDGRGACGPDDPVAPCGDDSFNSQTLIEAADTPGYFHNNLESTLLGAIEFYDSPAFASSGAGLLLSSLDSGGVAIDLGEDGAGQIEALLRVLNAVENIRSAISYQVKAQQSSFDDSQLFLDLALAEVDDALEVLAVLDLHLDAAGHLDTAAALLELARTQIDDAERNGTIDQVIVEQETARDLMIDVQEEGGFVLSRNPDFSTDDRTFATAETLHISLFSELVDFNAIVRAVTQLQDGDGNRIRQNLTNHEDGTYSASFDLSALPSANTDWTWSARIVDGSNVSFLPTDTITVQDSVVPSADFGATPVSGAAPLTVDFSDLSAGVPTSWFWDLGDGGTSSEQNPRHVYTLAGSYTVSLTATNASGSNTLTEPGFISVSDPVAPTADFSGTPLSGAAPLAVNFTDESTGQPDSWFWDFGDGDTSTEQHPIHVYANAGGLTVSLTASNSVGSDTLVRVDFVAADPPPAPATDFSAAPLSGSAPLSVEFTDSSAGVPTSWSWDFGDGGTSSEQHPTHVYESEGDYTVTLTVANASGSDTLVQTDLISVNSIPVGEGFILSKNADFSTDDRVFQTSDTLHILLFSDQLDAADISRSVWQLDSGGQRVRQSLTNHGDGTYTAVFDLDNLPAEETEWTWSARLVDGSGEFFLPSAAISVNP